MSSRATVQDETTKVQEYIRKMAPNDDLLSECLRQQKPDNEVVEGEGEPHGRTSPYHQQTEEVADF